MSNHIILSDFKVLDALYHWVIDNAEIGAFSNTLNSEYYRIDGTFKASLHFSCYYYLKSIVIDDNGNTTVFKVKE